MRQLLLITLAALLFGAAAIWLMQQDQGYVLISLGTTSIEMSFWLGAIIFVASSGVLIWLLLLLRWLLGAGGVRQWWVARRTVKQTNKTARGLLDFLSGDWSVASRALRQSVKDPALSKVSLLFAAKAAANNSQLDESRQLLVNFRAEYPDDEIYADLLLAESLIKASEIDEAQKILLAVKADNKMVLRLLSEVYYLQSDWHALSALIPKIKKQAAMDKAGLKLLQVKCYCGMLADNDGNLPSNIRGQKLAAIWSDIPRAFRQTPEIVVAYVGGLASSDAAEKALLVLSKSLKNHWHRCLVEAYGRLEIKDATKQLAMGEQWLTKYSEDAFLLLALGRICRRMGFLGKAKDYMKSTIKLQPSTQAYHELATILELLGDSKGSSEIYRQGLAFASQSAVNKG